MQVRYGLASPHRRRVRGMTLVELLVVLFILSMLAGALVPALWSGARQASKTYCASNMHQVLLGMAMYEVDYGEIPCDLAGQKVNEQDEVVHPGIAWATAVLPYVGSKQVFLCRADDSHGESNRRGIPCSWSYYYNPVSTQIFGGPGKELSAVSPIMACSWHFDGGVIIIGRKDTSIEICNPHKYAPLHVVFE
jgi:prepilin-type N-terminal cleavage/methylation domain-containing protein